MTLYPALCRTCHLSPAQGVRRRPSGKIEARHCLECARQLVATHRSQKRQVEALWSAELDAWKRA